MEHAPGTPLLGGLSATSILAPQRARRLPVVLADAAVRLHSIDPEPVSRQLAAIGPPRAATSVSEFLQALTAAADDLGRPDLTGAAQLLAELRPAAGSEVVCHGDLHPFNVLVDGDRVTVIDWTASLIAHPAYDVAFTWLLLVDAPLHVPKPLRAPIRIATGLVARAFLRRYQRRARVPVPDESLRWHVGLHCLRALVDVAGWTRAGELASHIGHPWLTSAPRSPSGSAGSPGSRSAHAHALATQTEQEEHQQWAGSAFALNSSRAQVLAQFRSSQSSLACARALVFQRC